MKPHERLTIIRILGKYASGSQVARETLTGIAEGRDRDLAKAAAEALKDAEEKPATPASPS